MALCEIKAELPRDQVSATDDLLVENGWTNWNVVEDVVLKRAWITGVFENSGEADRQWQDLEAVLRGMGIAASDPVRRALADVDWRDSYKAHFHAWQFGRLHWVPIWERNTFSLPAGDAVLWLDPGLAFGTGNHETTRLCVERLVALAEECRVSGFEFCADGGGPAETQTTKLKTQNRARRVLDAGCGSGILALSAALLGFRDIEGFDNDPEAVRVSEENAALNGLAGRVRFQVADLVTGLRDKADSVDILLANIQADVLMRHASELVGAVAPAGTLILSGILAGENAAVRTCFEELASGWSVNARTLGEWSDVVLMRPPNGEKS